jgi:hypothetical protein
VSYLDSAGTRTSGVVTSAALLSSGAVLQVGTDKVPLAGVLAVSAPATTP